MQLICRHVTCNQQVGLCWCLSPFCNEIGHPLGCTLVVGQHTSTRSGRRKPCRKFICCCFMYGIANMHCGACVCWAQAMPIEPIDHTTDKQSARCPWDRQGLFDLPHPPL
jgi:hypothetical protein